MAQEIDDPRREFLVKALTLGLFATPNLASLFQPLHARGDIPDQLGPGRSIYQFEGDVTAWPSTVKAWSPTIRRSPRCRRAAVRGMSLFIQMVVGCIRTMK